MPRSTWTDEEIATLLRLHTAGLQCREIASAMGRPRSTSDYRLAALGIREAPRTATLADRFEQRVQRGDPEECWLWNGYRNALGYGFLSAWPTVMAAHRLAYELAHGPIPDGLVVRHRCDNPPCVNPAHLELGTYLDNNRDKTERGRDAKGTQHGMARYDEETVREIKRRLAEGQGQTEIAGALGVNRATVHKIAAGKQWRVVKL